MSAPVTASGDGTDAVAGAPRRRRGGLGWLELGVTVAVGVTVVVLGTWAVFQDRGPDGGTPDPALTHVHGLGVNPGDGDLYVATHDGLLRLAGTAFERVGGRSDVMGFTVADADTFLASIHPGRVGGGDEPWTLGFVRSDDAGRSWEHLAFVGERDLHAITVTGSQVYAWDAASATLLSSADLGSTWEERGPVELTGLAVDPGASQRLVAVDGRRPLMSTDGGRSWAEVSGPMLALISWGPDGTLWGADEAGILHRSSDGLHWCRRSTLPGRPHALLAGDDAIWAAVTVDDTTAGARTVLVSSSDHGGSWSVIGDGGRSSTPSSEPADRGKDEPCR